MGWGWRFLDFLTSCVLFCEMCVAERVFGSLVVVVFQIVFRAEIHVNDVFSFFKNYF
jgi:hypothetical protein